VFLCDILLPSGVINDDDIKYKNTQSTINRKIYKRNKIKMNERVLSVIKAVQIEHTTNE